MTGTRAQGGETRLDRSNEFQQVQKKGNKSNRPQGAQRSQGDHVHTMNRAGSGGNTNRIAETQAAALGVGHAVAAMGEGSCEQPEAGSCGGSPSRVGMVSSNGVVNGVADDGARQAVTHLVAAPSLLPTSSECLPVPGVRVRSEEERLLIQTIDINLAADNSEVPMRQQLGAFRNFDLNVRNSNFRSFSEGTWGTNFPPTYLLDPWAAILT